MCLGIRLFQVSRQYLEGVSYSLQSAPMANRALSRFPAVRAYGNWRSPVAHDPPGTHAASNAPAPAGVWDRWIAGPTSVPLCRGRSLPRYAVVCREDWSVSPKGTGSRTVGFRHSIPVRYPPVRKQRYPSPTPPCIPAVHTPVASLRDRFPHQVGHIGCGWPYRRRLCAPHGQRRPCRSDGTMGSTPMHLR